MQISFRQVNCNGKTPDQDRFSLLFVAQAGLAFGGALILKLDASLLADADAATREPAPD